MSGELQRIAVIDLPALPSPALPVAALVRLPAIAGRRGVRPVTQRWVCSGARRDDAVFVCEDDGLDAVA